MKGFDKLLKSKGNAFCRGFAQINADYYFDGRKIGIIL